jgi:hypothetical protein
MTRGTHVTQLVFPFIFIPISLLHPLLSSMMVSSSPLPFSSLSSMSPVALAQTPWWARCGQSQCGLGSAHVEGWWLRGELGISSGNGGGEGAWNCWRPLLSSSTYCFLQPVVAGGLALGDSGGSDSCYCLFPWSSMSGASGRLDSG